MVCGPCRISSFSTSTCSVMAAQWTAVQPVRGVGWKDGYKVYTFTFDQNFVWYHNDFV